MNWLSTIIDIATLFAAAITAWATTMYWRSVKAQIAQDDPYVVFPHGRSVKRGTKYPIQMWFKVPESVQTKWEVQEVRVKRPFLAKLISAAGGYYQDSLGGIVGYDPKAWSRSIEIPSGSALGGIFLLSNSAPPNVELEFTLSLRSDSRTIRRWRARINITE